MADKKNKSFEESLNELEKVAQDIERGDLSLEQAIEEFEKGIKLSKECTEILDKAEKRINILVQGENGQLEEENFIQE